MIIVCEKCSKKFELKESLIPEKGRMLKCGNCGYKWFYQKEINLKNEIENQKDVIKSPIIDDKNKKNISKNNKNLKSSKINYFNFFLVSIITLIALVIIIDTFQKQLIPFFPELKNILYNLYETLTDLKLFLIDLFK